MELQGYAYLKNDIDTSKAMGEDQNWKGKIVRVMEFNDNSNSILCIDSSATKMAMFDYSEIELSFKCRVVGDILIPPEIEGFEKTEAAMKRLQRKGGYNETTKKMVIANSLQRKEFNDEFLFQKN